MAGVHELEEAKHGASFGKRARGLRVVMEDGEPVNPEAALTRNLMRFVDACPYVVPYLVGAYAISNSPKMQRYGDRVAETMVVVSSPAATDPQDSRLRLSHHSDRIHGECPRPAARRRRLAVVVTLLVVVGGSVAAVFLMRGGSG